MWTNKKLTGLIFTPSLKVVSGHNLKEKDWQLCVWVAAHWGARLLEGVGWGGVIIPKDQERGWVESSGWGWAGRAQCQLWALGWAHQLLHQTNLQCWRPGFSPWVGKIPWRWQWPLTPVFLPEESHGKGFWRATVHGVTKSWTQLSDQYFHFQPQFKICLCHSLRWEFIQSLKLPEPQFLNLQHGPVTALIL